MPRRRSTVFRKMRRDFDDGSQGTHMAKWRIFPAMPENAPGARTGSVRLRDLAGKSQSTSEGVLTAGKCVGCAHGTRPAPRVGRRAHRPLLASRRGPNMHTASPSPPATDDLDA